MYIFSCIILFKWGIQYQTTTIFSQSNAIHVVSNDVLTRMTCLHDDDGDTAKIHFYFMIWKTMTI
jgi:hypothetical protein